MSLLMTHWLFTKFKNSGDLHESDGEFKSSIDSRAQFDSL